MISNKIRQQIMNISNSNNRGLHEYYDVWFEYYQGNVTGFHKYNQQVNGSLKSCKRKTLNMPKLVCEEMTKLILGNEIKVITENKKLLKILSDNEFYTNFFKFYEQVNLFGIGATIEFLNDNKEIIIDYINADMLIPLSWENSKLTSLATISQKIEVNGKETFYTNDIVFHKFENNEYTIIKEVYLSKSSNDLGEKVNKLNDEKEIIIEFEKLGTIPRFQFYNLPNASNIDLHAKVAPSIFSKSLDKFNAIDEAYDSFSNEFVLGRKRIFIPKSFIKTDFDEDGKAVSYFDTNNGEFQIIEDVGIDNKTIIESDMSLRVQEHIDKINTEFSIISSDLGLDGNYFSFTGLNVAINEEQVSTSIRKTQETKLKYQKYILTKLNEMIRTILHIQGNPDEEFEIQIGIALPESTSQKSQRLLSELSLGIISKEEYLREIKGWNAEKISQNLKEMESSFTTNDLLNEDIE